MAHTLLLLLRLIRFDIAQPSSPHKKTPLGLFLFATSNYEPKSSPPEHAATITFIPDATKEGSLSARWLPTEPADRQRATNAPSYCFTMKAEARTPARYSRLAFAAEAIFGIAQGRPSATTGLAQAAG